MSIAEQNKLILAYEGSVKRVFQCPWQTESLLFQFTDDYSVFDWGKMPDSIENKGKALALFAACLFQRLADPKFWSELPDNFAGKHFDPEFRQTIFQAPTLKCLQKNGLASHFQGLVDKNGESLSLTKAASLPAHIYMQIKKAVVERPQDFFVLNQNIYDYPPQDNTAKTRLIPLEVIFRFGMPQGSSLTGRLQRDPSYACLLGLKSCPQPGEMFDRPVLEFFSKLETKDRLLSLQEALLISGLDRKQFVDLVERAQLMALACFHIFAGQGIELWDGKFEFVLQEGQVLPADSIGPDELRLIYKGTHLSKEMIRRVYRGTAWESALCEAQKLASQRRGEDWRQICMHELNSQPQPLAPEIKAVINLLYGVLVNRLSNQTLFAGHPDLDEFISRAKHVGL